MDGVDKEKVQRVVYEMSKGSKYFENEERKEAFIRQKIHKMRARCEKLSASDTSHYQMVYLFFPHDCNIFYVYRSQLLLASSGFLAKYEFVVHYSLGRQEEVLNFEDISSIVILNFHKNID